MVKLSDRIGGFFFSLALPKGLSSRQSCRGLCVGVHVCVEKPQVDLTSYTPVTHVLATPPKAHTGWPHT